jgi:hypothetical protein
VTPGAEASHAGQVCTPPGGALGARARTIGRLLGGSDVERPPGGYGSGARAAGGDEPEAAVALVAGWLPKGLEVWFARPSLRRCVVKTHFGAVSRIQLGERDDRTVS